MKTCFAEIKNGGTLPLSDVTLLKDDEVFSETKRCIAGGMRILSFFAMNGKGREKDLFMILGDDEAGRIFTAQTKVSGKYPSLTLSCPQAHLFEREIFEQHGIMPEGHPWLKPVRYTGSEGKRPDPAAEKFFQITGDAHEVAVGPVHAGVIEPGHFRFQCDGEKVLFLEIALGFQHRDMENLIKNASHEKALRLSEIIAGDSTVAHSSCFAGIMEALTGTSVSSRACSIRALALELERMANHTGDLGAIAGDTGYLPTSSFCGRIRGDFLNMTALVCGSRFGRGMVKPGGTGFDLTDDMSADLRKRLELGCREAFDAIDLMWHSQSVMARMENTGILSRDSALELGITGTAARASGLHRDSRVSWPVSVYRKHPVEIQVKEKGDVLARALVRWHELKTSSELIFRLMDTMPAGKTLHKMPEKKKPSALSLAIYEGWRGEVLHAAVTDKTGKIAEYKISDPSFHNWQGLSRCLRGQAISDFPLCNKSFNLSYCGHDL